MNDLLFTAPHSEHVEPQLVYIGCCLAPQVGALFSSREVRELPARQWQLWYAEALMTTVPLPPELAKASGTQGAGRYSDEVEFVEALRRREPPAFEELCRRHLARVRVVLFRVLGNDAEIADLAQEAVLSAMKAAPKFRGESGQLGAWFTSIAVNTARDAIRKKQLFRRFFARDDSVSEHAQSRLASVEQVETIKRTYQVLEKMSADDRIAFSLRIIDQMTMDEVAETCGTSVSTAKRRVEKARQRFNLLASRDPLLADLLGGEP